MKVTRRFSFSVGIEKLKRLFLKAEYEEARHQQTTLSPQDGGCGDQLASRNPSTPVSPPVIDLKPEKETI